MNSGTVQGTVPEGEYYYRDPFVVVDHRVRDIGLVGWNNYRWVHQDKAHRCKSPESGITLRKRATVVESQTAWKQAFDPESRKYYFYNVSEGVTSWDPPHEPFTSDETVKHYLQSGIAQPWVQAGCKREASFTPSESLPSLPEVLAAPHAKAHDSLQMTQIAEDNSLTPAHVKFSPLKKGDLAKNVERYWVLRYSLFSRWSLGVVLNEKSLFSVTPEVIAKHHAAMLRGGNSVLDAFCGCGGNTIHLAAVFKQVFACEVDHEQLCMAKHNCEVYGVAEGVTWIHGDVFYSQIAPVDAVFLSPPWGGPDIGCGCKGFDASVTIKNLGRSIKECIAFACSCLSTCSLSHDTLDKTQTPNLAVYLPKNTCVSTLQVCLDVVGFRIVPLCLERNILNEKLKSATLYCRVTSL